MSQSYQVSNSEHIEALWVAQDGRCALCGEVMLRNRFEAPHARIWAKRRTTIDHIHPRSKGGTDAHRNLQLTHAVCNKIKGNRV